MGAILMIVCLPVFLFAGAILWLSVRYVQYRTDSFEAALRIIPWLLPLGLGLSIYGITVLNYQDKLLAMRLLGGVFLIWVMIGSLPVLGLGVIDEAYGIVFDRKPRRIVPWAAAALLAFGVMQWGGQKTGELDRETFRKANLAIEYEAASRGYVHDYVTKGVKGLPRIMAVTDAWIAKNAGRLHGGKTANPAASSKPRSYLASAVAQAEGQAMNLLFFWTKDNHLDRHHHIMKGWNAWLSLIVLWTGLCALEGVVVKGLELLGRGYRRVRPMLPGRKKAHPQGAAGDGPKLSPEEIRAYMDRFRAEWNEKARQEELAREAARLVRERQSEEEWVAFPNAKPIDPNDVLPPDHPWRKPSRPVTPAAVPERRDSVPIPEAWRTPSTQRTE